MWFLIFLKSFVAIPSLLIGIFVILGCILQRKKFSETIVSTIKTIVSFLVLQGGSLIITNALSTFTPVFQDLFGLTGANLSNEATVGALTNQAANIVSIGAIVMVVAMFLNVLFAKFSRYKYVFLSGHVLLYLSIAMVGVFHMLFINTNTAYGYAMAVITCSLLLGLYMTLAPAVIQPWVRAATKSDDIAIAHGGTLGYFITGVAASVIYKLKKGKIKSTESIKFPKGLSFFRNTTVSMSIFMLIFFLAIYVPEGIRYEMGKITATTLDENGKVLVNNPVWNIMHNGSATYSGTEQNWIITALLQSFTFAAGIYVVLMGVNGLIAELVPAFRGISKKMIQNGKAGLDIPVLFPFAPTAALIGLVSGFCGALVGMGITIACNVQVAGVTYIILPAIMSVVFTSGGAAIIGNSKGGILGAVIGSFISAIMFTVFPLIYLKCGWYPVDGDSNVLSLGWASIDFILGVIPMLFSFIPNHDIGVGVYTAVLVIIVVAMISDGFFYNKKQKQIEKEKIQTSVETEKLNTVRKES